MNEPAFPTLHIDDPEYRWTENGMTLRDYFAAAALTGLMEQSGVLNRPGRQFRTERATEIAKWAYEFADAMLKARESQAAPHTPKEAK